MKVRLVSVADRLIYIYNIFTNHVSFSIGHLDTFKHHKKDITEAGKGLECGLSVGGFDGLEEGDLIQVFEKIEKPGIL